MAEEKLQNDEQNLGLAGKIANTFINTPVTPMLLVACLLIGLMGLYFTPRQEDPQISVPMIDVFLSYPGASAEQVASLVTEPFERLMSEIPGVRHVYSATERGRAIVTVRFYVGEDLGESIVKVRDKYRSNLDKMPPDVMEPLIKPVAIDDVPTVTLTLWSEEVDDSILRILGLDVLQRLGEVPNTGKGFVVGGRADQIRVEIMPERLAGYGLSLSQVADTIRTANSERNVGGLEASDSAFTVYSGSFLRTASDIERLVIAIRNGAPVYVRDVANVIHGPEEAKSVSSFYAGSAYPGAVVPDGAQAVTVAIAKKKGTNGVEVSRDILDKVESLKGVLIPNNVHIEVTRDYGHSANQKVNELLAAMFEAAFFVSVLCVIGLGWRAAFVVITVIPIVILVTIWWAWMVDYTIDRVSLFALIFAIGIMVDDATVVVENIFRHWLEKGSTSIRDAVAAVAEVGNPTILATFTIIAALLPMGWVSGLMGPYMRPIPVLGASAMFFSLVAAFIFTPWFAVKVAPKLESLEKAQKREHKTRGTIAKIYRPLIMPLVRSRKLGWIFLIGIIAATAMTCLLFYPTQWVAVKMLPFDNKPEFSVIVNMPEGTSMPVTANVVHELASAVKELPEVVAVQTYAGTAQPFNFNGMVRHYYLRQRPWEGDLLVQLKDKTERERGSHEIAVEARHILKPVADRLGARIAVVEMPPGPPVLQTVVAEIYGPDAGTRREVARKMTEFFEQAEGVVDVDNYMTEPSEYWRFEVNTEKAVRQGISVDAINGTLAMAMGGYRLGDVKRGTVQEPTYIVLQVPLSVRSSISALNNLPVPNPAGRVVPLGELGRFVREQNSPTIYHKDLRAIEYVVGEMEGKLGAPIYGMFNVEAFTDEYTTPDGVIMEGMPMNLIGPPDSDEQSGFEWTGEWTVTFETFRDMGLAFMAAMVLIYGLIVWEFRDFALAGLIMSPIPVTLLGIIPGHWIMDAEFTATSMIGMIALGGIIVRQSILIVEFVKIEVAKGKRVVEAAVDGAEIRMRPIFITSLTLMAGAFAILDDPIFNGMAISLLFGAGVATVMAVLIIPLGCISLKENFYRVTTDCGEVVISEQFEKIEGEKPAACEQAFEYKTPLWMRIYSLVFSIFEWLFVIGQMLFNIGRMVFGMIMARFASKPDQPPSSPPPAPSSAGSGSGPAGGGAPATPGDAGAAAGRPAEKVTETAGVSKAAAAKEEPGEKTQGKQTPGRKTVSKKAAVKKTAAAKAAPPAGATAESQNETDQAEDAPAVKKKAVKRKAAKKASARQASAKKTVKKKAAPKKISTVKAQASEAAAKDGKAVSRRTPTKKSTSGGRRGIRIKDEE